MKTEDVRELWKTRQREMGLVGWVLKFDHSKTNAGTCLTTYWNTNPSMSRGIITLSMSYMEVFDYEDVLETINHEMAHAITNPRMKAHGPEWKASCRKTGSNGRRVVRQEANRPESRYVGTCSGGHKFSRHKKVFGLTQAHWFMCPSCTKRTKEKAWITWTDTRTNTVLNPAPVEVVYETPGPLFPKTANLIVAKDHGTVNFAEEFAPQRVKVESFAQRFDQGSTSFDDVW